MSSADESLSNAEELLARLEAARAELEQLSAAGEGSPEASSDRAIELLGELAELAKAVEAELEKAQRAAGTDA